MTEIITGIVSLVIAGFILFRVVQAIAVTVSEAQGSDKSDRRDQ